MPNVRPSSGMIGTTRLPIWGSRHRLRSKRVNPMVVDTACELGDRPLQPSALGLQTQGRELLDLRQSPGESFQSLVQFLGEPIAFPAAHLDQLICRPIRSLSQQFRIDRAQQIRCTLHEDPVQPGDHLEIGRSRQTVVTLHATQRIQVGGEPHLVDVQLGRAAVDVERGRARAGVDLRSRCGSVPPRLPPRREA